MVHGDEPQVFLAEDEWVISRVLALQLVALTPSAEISSLSRLQAIREALLQEQWDVALAEWIDETGNFVDVFPSRPRSGQPRSSTRCGLRWRFASPRSSESLRDVSRFLRLIREF